jgi:flagellar assembly protein FliH
MGTAQSSNGAARIESFIYPAGAEMPIRPDWQGWSEEPASVAPEPAPTEPARSAVQIAAEAAFEKRLAEETQRAHEAGRERGRQEGRQAEREAQVAAQRAAEDLRLRQKAELVQNFEQARNDYLQAVEHEVVRLALAIAARILRREAQMDPLLLTGAVRVALGQLSGTTEVRLRVPTEDLALWTEAIALLPSLALKPKVVAGEGLHLGECVIETALGSVDLGIRSQLGEIERGFFDRAGAGRPGTESNPAVQLDAIQPASSQPASAQPFNSQEKP